jgi:hypothetical protein
VETKTDYLIESNRKRQLSPLLATYTLLHTVNFATRIQNNACTAIDNIFVDDSRINWSSLSPIVNGLSKHNAQVLKIKNINATINKFPLKQSTRLIEIETIMDFQTVLEKETRESI